MVRRHRAVANRATDDKPKTDAKKNFEDNLDQIMAFINRLNSSDVLRAKKTLARAIRKEVAAAPNINIKRLERAVAAHGAAINKWLEFMYPACRWMSVMLLSFMQTYLEEGLVSRHYAPL